MLWACVYAIRRVCYGILIELISILNSKMLKRGTLLHEPIEQQSQEPGRSSDRQDTG